MAEPIQTLTGTQVPLDAAYIANLAAQNEISIRGQDVQAHIAAANNATQLAVSQGNNATSLAVAQLQAYTAQDATNKQYQVDIQRLGLERADLLRQQRMDQVNALLGYNSQVLQAQGLKVDSKFRALELLASRSGPQDWPAYAYLLRQMGAPTGEAVDPTQFSDMITMPERPNIEGMTPAVAQTGATGSSGGAMTNGSVRGSTAVFNPSQAAAGGAGTLGLPAPQTSYTPMNGYPTQVSGAGTPPSQQQGMKGDTFGPGAQGSNNPPNQWISPQGTILPMPKPVGQLPAAANGMPYMNHPAVMVGDARGPNPQAGGAKPEVVLNPTGAPIGVMSNEQMQQMMAQAKQMPRFAEGSGIVDNTMVQPKQSGAWNTMGSTFGQQRSATRPRGGAGTGQLPSWMQRFANNGNPGGQGPITTMPIDPVTNTPPAPAPGTNAAVGSSAPDYQADNVGSTTTTPDAQGANGTYGMPDLPKYMQYSPEVLAAQPWIQSLFGKAAPEFQGFGATLSNPALGLNNVPSTFSLQNYLALNPSERDMVQSLYQQGLAVDFRDILEKARRATPTGGSYGNTFYGN